MAAAPDPSKTAMQYLIWTIEHIEKAGNQVAVRHARNALRAEPGQGITPHQRRALTDELKRKRIASAQPEHRARLCTTTVQI